MEHHGCFSGLEMMQSSLANLRNENHEGMRVLRCRRGIIILFSNLHQPLKIVFRHSINIGMNPSR